MPEIIQNTITQGSNTTITIANPTSLLNNIEGDNILEYHILKNNEIISSNYQAENWSIEQVNSDYYLKTDTEFHLHDNQLYQGSYDISYLYYKRLLGNAYQKIIQIDEISNSRTEIRVKLNDDYIEDYTDEFEYIYNLPTKFYSKRVNICINTLNNNLFQTINWIKDPDNDNAILFKLLNPLPDDIKIGITIILCIPFVEPTQFQTNLYISDVPQNTNVLKNPNWNIKIENRSRKLTNFYNWNSLSSLYSTGSYKLIDKYFSGSLSGINLNIDYSNYENFIFYSSAEERLKNFKYKLQLIENYNNTISSLYAQVSSSIFSDVVTLNNNIEKYNEKLNNLIGTFDDYEKYLYYESTSIDIESPSWPKSNSIYPYTLYLSNTNTAETWYENQIYTASLYDRNNINNLIYSIPQHVLDDDENDGYITFVEMVAHHFDILWIYIKHLIDVNNRQESLYEGLSKDLIYDTLKSFGWNTEFGNQFDDLWLATFGGNEYSSSLYIQSDNQNIKNTSREDVSKQIWKRILNNLPYILKSKGTAQGIRALINCYGIPDTILRIKEYGGPEPYTNKSYYTYNKFNYAWQPTGSVNYFFTITGSSFPNSIEFRFKTINANESIQLIDQSKRIQTLLTNRSGSLAVNALRLTYVDKTLGNIEFLTKDILNPTYNINSIQNIPIYDGNWWSVLINQNNYNTCSLYIKHAEEDNITHAYSMSFYLPLSETWSLANNCTIDFPGNISSSINPSIYPFNIFDGQVQELRFWNNGILTESAFNNHVRAVNSYNGNSLTASYYDLQFRLSLGTEAHLSNSLQTLYTSSSDILYYAQSHHPNYLTNFYTCINQPSTMSFIENIEMRSMEWPDVSANRIISNKIRIEDNNAFLGNVLDLKRRTEISSNNLYPNDTAKLGIYLSPTNEINEDIAQQMGGFRIDDYIGDEEDDYTDEYKDLLILRNEYFKKYNERINFLYYNKLLKYFDYSLFNQLKKMLPVRTRAIIGSVIEPHILERSKIKLITKPTYEFINYETTIKYDDIGKTSGYQSEVSGNVSLNISNLIGEVNCYESNNLTHSLQLSGESNNYSSSLNIYNYINLSSSSISNTIITSSVPSSTKKIEYYYVTNTSWISGTPSSCTNVPLTLEYSGSARPWDNVDKAAIDDTIISQLSSTPFSLSGERYEATQILRVGGFNINYDFSNVHSIRGIQLRINRYAQSNTETRYAKDYIVKIYPGLLNDTSNGDNKAKNLKWETLSGGGEISGIYSYYGNQDDKWGLSWNKSNIKYITAGVSALNYYKSTAPNHRPMIDSLNIKLYFNTKQYRSAYIQDFEPNDLANLKYNGCKIYSTDFNQPSTDTPDGSPVVSFKIINQNTSTYINQNIISTS